MISRTVTLPFAASSGLAFDEPGNAVWFATEDGTIWSWRLLGERLSAAGSGWTDLVAVLPAADGLAVFVVGHGGEIHRARREAVTAAEAELWFTHATGIVAAALSPDGEVVLLDDAGDVRVLDHAATIRTVASATGAAALCMLPDAGEVALAVPAGQDTEIERRALADGSVQGTVTVQHPVLSLTAHGSGVAVADDAGRVTHVSWSSGEGSEFADVMGAASGISAWHSLVFAAAGTELTAVDWNDDVTTLPIERTLQPLAAGGWLPVTVDYGSVGIGVDEVDWMWEDNPLDECISVAGHDPSDPGRWEHRVLGGPVPGERTLVAAVRATGDTLATARFRILAGWPDEVSGPPQVISGERTVFAKSGWGGGPGSPQNIRVHPAPDEFRIAVAVFRCKGSTSAVSAEPAATARRDELTEHVVRTTGDSVDRWFRETSYADTPGSVVTGTRVRLLTGAAIGPIDVPFAFAELFDQGEPGSDWGSWNPKADTWDRLGGTLSTFVRDTPVTLGGVSRPVMEVAHAVVFMILPGNDDPVEIAGKTFSAQWPWAWATDAQVYWKPSDGSTTFSRKPATLMPAAISANHPSPWSEKEYVTTIVHELGHNLGMPDLYKGAGYPGEIDGRYLDDWDMMAADVPMHQLSLPHRMRLGWIDPAWVEVCDFAKNPATREVILQALETLTRSGPGAGRKAGVEIRLRDGWNYYFEHRRDQPGQIGDQHLPSDAVLGTDVFQAKADDMARPLVLLLPNDVDGDGPELNATSMDYEESDVTNPDRMNDFRLTRLPRGIGDSANDVRVRVEYVGAHRAELQITPARGNGRWKSPDIDIAGPGGDNIVVKGQKHRIRIRVRNAGTKAADSVTLRVGWLPFTTTPGAWTSITPPAAKPIGAKSSATFEVDWDVPGSVTVPDAAGNSVQAEHFCVRVDIDRYVDPLDPTGSEIVVHNNWAQSNFSTTMTAQASPSSRESTAIVAANPFPTRALHRHVVEQTGQEFRLFLDQGWHVTDAGATTASRLAYESFAGDPRRGPEYARFFEESGGEGVASDVSVRTFVLPEGTNDTGIPGFGAGLWLRAGWRTEFEDVRANGEVIFGRLVYEHDGAVDPVAFGEVRVVAQPVDRPDEVVWLDGGVNDDGTFYVPLTPEVFTGAHQERWTFEVFFHSTYRFAPARSGTLPLEL